MDIDTSMEQMVPRSESESFRKIHRSTSLQVSSQAKMEAQDGQMPQLVPLPRFQDVPEMEQLNLFLRKIQQCCVIFPFGNGEDIMHSESKNIKSMALQDLRDFVTDPRHLIPDAAYGPIVNMIATNIFRPFPPPTAGKLDADPDDDDEIFDTAWPHLQLVYEFMLRFVESPHLDANTFVVHLGPSFLLQLIELFMSEDPRERDYLKTILHRIYGAVLAHRSFIRKSITSIFQRCVYEDVTHPGIAELLEILGSIINGFSTPLREEHKIFLKRTLIGMHKVPYLSSFHPQLCYCMVQFLEKEPPLVSFIVKSLLRYWPKTNRRKELLFISELEELVEVADPDDLVQVQVILFKKIASCISSVSFQIAESALKLWNNEFIISFLMENRGIRALTYNVLKRCMKMDVALFDMCAASYEVNRLREKEKEAQREKRWHAVEIMARENRLRAGGGGGVGMVSYSGDCDMVPVTAESGGGAVDMEM